VFPRSWSSRVSEVTYTRLARTHALLGHIKITTIPPPHDIHRVKQNNAQKKTQTPRKKSAQEKIKIDVLKQMYLNVNDENAILLEYFNLTTNIQCSGFNQ
jgi:CRISPR/Cas system CMR-associated protein Cmr1 (group 7 of RAMP superfamily)